MAESHQRPGSGVSRREFVKTVGTAALAASSPLILPSMGLADARRHAGRADPEGPRRDRRRPVLRLAQG